MTFTTTIPTGAPHSSRFAQDVRELSDSATQPLVLRFFKNHAGFAVGDLFLGNRRLLATTHPATIVGAIYALGLKRLRVETASGQKTANLRFSVRDILMAKLRMDLNPRLYHYIHLATTQSELKFLEALNIFSHEGWATATGQAEEHLRTAHHHLPADLVARPLTGAAPTGWRKTLKARNKFVYFPFC